MTQAPSRAAMSLLKQSNALDGVERPRLGHTLERPLATTGEGDTGPHDEVLHMRSRTRGSRRLRPRLRCVRRDGIRDAAEVIAADFAFAGMEAGSYGDPDSRCLVDDGLQRI